MICGNKFTEFKLKHNAKDTIGKVVPFAEFFQQNLKAQPGTQKLDIACYSHEKESVDCAGDFKFFVIKLNTLQAPHLKV